MLIKKLYFMDKPGAAKSMVDNKKNWNISIVINFFITINFLYY